MTTVTASSAEVEMTVLGCMMNSEDSFLAVHEIIETDDFADSRHRIIFNAIKESHKSKGAIDIVIIGETLKKNGNLQEVGSYGYLATLSQFAGTSAHIEAYCDDLRQLTIKRTLLNVHRGLAEDIESGIDPHTILERLGTKVEDIKANKPKADSVFRHLLDAASESESPLVMMSG